MRPGSLLALLISTQICVYVKVETGVSDLLLNLGAAASRADRLPGHMSTRPFFVKDRV